MNQTNIFANTNLAEKYQNLYIRGIAAKGKKILKVSKLSMCF